MAIKYKDLAKKSKESPLTDNEIEFIDELENYIDSEIKKQFKSSGCQIKIELGYVLFERFPRDRKNDIHLNLGYDRTKKMRKEIEARYKLAGWKTETKYGDFLDGPNFSGPDYWILKGK